MSNTATMPRPETRILGPRPPDFASIDEAAGFTRLSQRTLRRACAAGTLKRYRVGSRYLFSYSDLSAFVRGESH